jgi:hypothetical protein
MNEECFVDQIANRDILLRVTNVCGECYDDLQEGDHIYYDMQTYRYLCKRCKENLAKRMNDQCEVMEEDGVLFG